MSVDIELDLEAGDFYRELSQVEILLKSIGQDLDNIDIGGDIGSISDEIENLVRELDELEAKMGRIGRDMRGAADAWRDVDFDPDFRMPDGGTHSGDGGGGGGPPDGDRVNPYNAARAIEGRFGFERGAISPEMMKGMNLDEINEIIADFYHEQMDTPYPTRNLGAGALPAEYRMGEDGRFFDYDERNRGLGDQMRLGSFRSRARALGRDRDLIPDIDMREAEGFHRMRDFFGRIDDRVDAFGDTLNKLRPTMAQWWQLLAMLIPLLISVGVHALGVAAALGAMGVAGAGLIGLGLLGHADSMGEAFAEAKNEVADFKQELFDTFSPTAQLFAGTQARFFDYAPDALQEVAMAMQGLQSYDDTLFEIFDAGVGGVAAFFDILTRNEEVISELSTRFGGLLGNGALEFFEWLIVAASNNQEQLIQLGGVLVKIAATLYNVSVAASYVVTTFTPLLNIILFLSELLNSPIAIGLATFIVSMMMAAKVVMTLAGAMNQLAVAMGFKGALSMIASYTGMTWGAVAATMALAGAIALVSFGVSALAGIAAFNAVGEQGTLTPGGTNSGPDFGGGGASPSGTGMGGSGQTVINNYEFTNNGPMDSATEQSFRSQFQRMQGEEAATEPPSTTLPSQDSAPEDKN